MILDSRLGPRWDSAHQLPQGNHLAGCPAAVPESPPLPVPAAEGSFSVHHCWRTPHAHPAVGKSCFFLLFSSPSLLEGLQGFGSNDHTIMEFKSSLLSHEAHGPDMRPKLQLAYHLSHNMMMAPLLFSSTVPPVPPEISLGICANWDQGGHYFRVIGVTRPPGQTASWKELGPHSLGGYLGPGDKQSWSRRTRNPSRRTRNNDNH